MGTARIGRHIRTTSFIYTIDPDSSVNPETLLTRLDGLIWAFRGAWTLVSKPDKTYSRLTFLVAEHQIDLSSKVYHTTDINPTVM